MLKALLLNREPFEEKKRILEDECHIRLTTEEEDTLKTMYGWGDYFYDQGFAAASAKHAADLRAIKDKLDADKKKGVEAMLERGFDLPTIQACMVLDEEKLNKILREIELEKANCQGGGQPAQANAEG